MLMTDGGGGDLPPGDPSAVRASASALGQAAAAVTSTGATVRSRAAALQGSGIWSGHAASSFEGAATRYSDHLRTLEGALRSAAGALNGYAAALEAAQAAARAADAAVARAGADYRTGMSRLAAATPPPAHDPAAVSRFQADQTRAQDALSSALNAAAAQADAGRRQAFADAKRAAAQAAAAVENATGSIAPLGFWDKAADLNDKAGWALNSWGVFGAYLIGKQGVSLEEAEQALSGFQKEETTLDGVIARYGENSLETLNAWMRLQETSGVDAIGLANQFQAEAKAFHEAVVPGDWNLLGVAGKAGLVAGMASDVVTLVHPSNTGALGVADRVMSGGNLAASGAVAAEMLVPTLAIPVAGEVVIGGVLVTTAGYFATEFVVQHWSDITGAVSWAGDKLYEGDLWLGQQEIKAADWAGTQIKNGAEWAGTQIDNGATWAGAQLENGASWAVNTVSDGVGTAVSWGENAASDVVSTLSSPVKALTSWLP